MPIISQSSYHHPSYLFNGHVQTIVPSMFRKIEGIRYQRERLELADGDFLDLDWLKQKAQKLVIISHGLEGNSERHYVMGMAKYFSVRGWDALAWNCRGCSGEMNRLPKFYHHGATEDLKAVVEHAVSTGAYSQVALVGISMGGSLTLKYFGESGDALLKNVKCASVFSVPCHLGDSAKELDKPNKRFYLNRFLKKLSKKIEAKSKIFPNEISHIGFERIKTFREFDTRYTAPLHGFKDADDFYTRASSGAYIASIAKPVLIVNALNDPFLPQTCFPFDVARTHASVWLETPATGGHVGFSLKGKQENWMEVRAFEFIQQYIQ
ncbi:MAG: YheT family hydrolase [Cytophagales bacterium]